MSAPVTVELDGAPVAKARARFGKGRAYTPAATRHFEHSLAWAAKAAMAGRKPFTGAVKIVARFELPIPTSWPVRKRADAIAGEVHPAAKPDLDNFVKAALDAINGIVIADDAQVVEVAAKKVYGASPKTVLTATPLSNGVQMAPELTCLLQEIFVAESSADIDLLATRAVEMVAALTPSQREDAVEKIQDAIAEWGGR